MRYGLIYTVIFGALLTVACSSAATRPPTPLSEEIEELALRLSEAVVRASSSGWARDEVEALAALYSEDTILFPPRGEPIRGRAAVRAYWTRTADRRILEHTVLPTRVEVDHVLAIEYGHVEMISVVGDAQPTEGRANHISVWRGDQAGMWRKHPDLWW